MKNKGQKYINVFTGFVMSIAILNSCVGAMEEDLSFDGQIQPATNQASQIEDNQAEINNDNLSDSVNSTVNDANDNSKNTISENNEISMESLFEGGKRKQKFSMPEYLFNSNKISIKPKDPLNEKFATKNKTGRLNLSLTDFPIDDAEVTKVLIRFDKIEINSAEKGWLTIADYSNAPVEFDLMTLQNGNTALFGSFKLDVGKYEQIKLHLSDNNTLELVRNGTIERHQLKTPSGQQSGLKLVNSFEITESGITSILVDFDAQKSIVINKSHYILKPTVKILSSVTKPVLTIYSPTDGEVTQFGVIDIKGKIDLNSSGPVENLTIFYNGEEYSNIAVDASGNFEKRLPIPQTAEEVKYKIDALLVTQSGQNFRASSSFTYLPAFVKNQVLIRFHPFAKKDDIAQVINELQGEISNVIYTIKFYRITLPDGSDIQGIVDLLNEHWAVAYAMPNALGKSTATIPNDPHFFRQWAFNNTGQDIYASDNGTVDADIDLVEAWDINTGSKDVIVAVLDTGIDFNNLEIASNLYTNPREAIGDNNSDGCPGICGVDDDNDGFADLEDFDVRNIYNNGVDDDGDGIIDEQNSDGGGDWDGAINDDDENGYIDDIRGWDFVDNDNDPSFYDNPSENDTYYHGTQVASIIGAGTDNGSYFAGINWEVSILPLRIMGGSLQIYDVIRAYQYASDMGASITNNSFTFTLSNPSESYIKNIQSAMKDVNDLSVLHVVAAGNEGVDLEEYHDNCSNFFAIHTPSANGTIDPNQPCYLFPQMVDIPNKVVVTSTDYNDETWNLNNISSWVIPSFYDISATTSMLSNYGPYVDIAAPGNEILVFFNETLSLTYWNGTSFASPHVAGQAALILAEYPEYLNQPLMLKELILSSGDDLANLVGLVTTGKRININNALQPVNQITPLTFINGTKRIIGNERLNSGHTIACDVNNDTYLDVIVLSGFIDFEENQLTLLYINDGSGNFVNESETRLNLGQYNSIGGDCGDINNDGYNDLVLGSFFPEAGYESQRVNKILINQGASQPGFFNDETSSRMPTIPLRPNGDNPLQDITRDIDLFDADNDGDLDMFVSNIPNANDKNRLYLNENGYFTNASNQIPYDSGDTHNAHIGDIDNDGDLDIYICNQQPSEFPDSYDFFGTDILLINNGSGNFTDESIARGLTIGADNSHEARLVDVNGDSWLDIIIARRKGEQNQIFINDQDGTFTNETATRFPVILDDTSGLDVGDVDNDGDIDIIFANGDPNTLSTGQNTLLINDGTGVFTEMGEAYGIPQGVINTTKQISLFDADNDGDLDIWSGNFAELEHLFINTTLQ